MKYLLKNDISFLELDRDTLNILKNNDILTINDLWTLSRDDLKTFGLLTDDINKIAIKLQLQGLDLNRKVFN